MTELRDQYGEAQDSAGLNGPLKTWSGSLERLHTPVEVSVDQQQGVTYELVSGLTVQALQLCVP